MKMPEIGDDVYVGGSYYIDHGEDDFHGGLCKIMRITKGTSLGKSVPFVEVAERPGHSYNWEILAEKQAELKAEFGNSRGFEDPDYA